MANWFTSEVTLKNWHVAVILLTLIVVIIILAIVGKVLDISSFTNDGGSTQRGDVSAEFPVYKTESLRERQQGQLSKVETVSPLTGSRDVPVYFEGYDYDASRGKAGAISQSREGFEGGLSQNELENILKQG